MRATKIILDDKAVYLRLSASKLAEYAKSIDSSGNTLFAVMDALDDLQKQAGELEKSPYLTDEQEQALEDAKKKYVGPNPKILALPMTFKTGAVHLCMKDDDLSNV